MNEVERRTLFGSSIWMPVSTMMPSTTSEYRFVDWGGGEGSRPDLGDFIDDSPQAADPVPPHRLVPRKRRPPPPKASPLLAPRPGFDVWRVSRL